MKIESFEKGCEICGYDPTKLPIVDHLPVKHQKAPIASYKLFVISEASWKGEDKKIDWNNKRQYKWSPYWWLDNPGFRLCDSFYSYAITNSAGGSRLCTFSDEDQRFFMKECIALWADSFGGKLPQ